MARLISNDPEGQMRRMRRTGAAQLPYDPIRARTDQRDLLQRGTLGSLDEDVRSFENLRRSEGRQLLSDRGYRDLNMKNLSGAGPEALDKINAMRRQRTGNAGGGMGNATVAWPKLRDPFEQFREKSWWFLKEGDFSQSLKKIREWSLICNTPISTCQGIVLIQDIQVGDKVLTHKGRYRKVSDTWNREDDTTLWTIKPHYVLSFAATEGHKVWTRRDNVEQWIPIQQITTDDQVFIPVDKTIEDRSCVSVWETLDSIDWIEKEGVIVSKNQVQINGYKWPNFRKTLDTKVELTPEFLRLIGLYLAEGFVHKTKTGFDRVTLALGSTEWNLVEDVVRGFKSMNLETSVEDRTDIDHTIQVTSRGVPLAHWFAQAFGVGSENKHLPVWALLLPKEKQAEILRGYFDGDGNIGQASRQKDVKAGTTSLVLAEQIQRLIMRAGFMAKIYIDERNKRDGRKNLWFVGPATYDADRFGDFVGWDTSEWRTIEGKSRQGGYAKSLRYATLVENGFWTKIHRISSAPYKGTVYDITVEEDYSFVTSVAVHNCRLVYMTHPLIPSLIDIYARFPLLDIEFRHEDKQLSDFYNDLFLNELNYQEFLFDMAREYWTVGETFALGSWHEGIGSWDADELLNPDDVIVSRNSILRLYQYHLKVPEGIKKLIETRQPREEYEMLVRFYPYILQWAQQNAEIPVSDVLLKQLKFKVNCLIGTTQVMTPDGSVMAKDLNIGDEVVSWDSHSNKFAISSVSQTGIKPPEPIYWITTRSGRKIGVTGEHPFWTKQGWIVAQDLIIGGEVYAANRKDKEYIYPNADWDPIRSIEIGEPEETIALGIEKYHTHVTAGLVSHNSWEPHGVPILMRAFKTMMLEMSLEAAQDAVADRLYSPLILANLGIEDVGDGEGPWIPEPEEIDALRDDLALALMSDFRLMVYHHGLNIQSVFGREVMPRFDMDFERVDMKLMQIFGIGPELLQGGNSSAPYASGALNRELITQMLTTYQVSMKRFLRERMEVVAERQGHYEFEKRGDQRFPVYETVLMQNELTGEEYVEERPKLAIPEPVMRTMNLRDETVERQFKIELRQSGVPISDESLMVNIAIEFDEEVNKIQREKMDKVLAELHYQKRLFLAIFINHLPVPPEYAQAYMEFVSGVQGMALMMGGTDVTSGAPTPNLFPMVEPSPGDIQNAMMVMGGPSTRSEESDEQRAGAPRQASIDIRPESPFVMYASEDQVNEFKEIGLDAWFDKYTNNIDIDEIKTSKKIDDNDSQIEVEHVASGFEWTEDLEPIDPEDAEAVSIRVAGIKTMASPDFMILRRKMRLPKGAKVKEVTAEEIDEAKRRLDESDADTTGSGGMEGEGPVLGEDDQS